MRRPVGIGRTSEASVGPIGMSHVPRQVSRAETMSSHPPPESKHSAGTRRSRYAGLLIGIGLMAAVDEIIFHQILAWHHFYDGASLKIGLMSDGLLHAAELVAVVAGFFLLADVNRQQQLVRRQAWAGFFVGAGGFQLFDGIIDHKVLRLHQIRYDVPILPYDVLWNLAGATLLVIGLVLWRRQPVRVG
jgi:uncharacterized membrane protein